MPFRRKLVPTMTLIATGMLLDRWYCSLRVLQRGKSMFPELRRWHICRGAASYAAAAWTVSASLALAAPQGPAPNFAAGTNVGWQPDFAAFVNSDAVRLLGLAFLPPPPGEPQPVTLDPKIFNKEHPFDPFRRGDLGVADLTNPNLQSWVVDALRTQNERVLSGQPMPQNPITRCWPAGLPLADSMTMDPMYIIQKTDEVLILNKRQNAQVRRVALNRTHSSNPKPSWFGESVGHYENGDTLVIDTIGLNDRTPVDFFGTPHTLALHVLERWTLTADGKSLEVRVRVEDPGAFKAPYEMTQRFRRVEQPWLEYECAENPYDPLHQGLEPIPHADKPDF